MLVLGLVRQSARHVGRRDMDIQRDMHQLLLDAGSTQITRSAYDTAWIARLGDIDGSLLLAAFLMNIAYMLAGGAIFGWTLRLVRKKGYLSRTHVE